MVSQAFKTAVYAQQTDQVPLIILELYSDELAEPIRVVNNGEDITIGSAILDHNGDPMTDHNGDPIYDQDGAYTYTAFPFEVQLPDMTAEAPPRARLTICNVDRQIVAAVRSITQPMSVWLAIILAGTPMIIEDGPYEFQLTNVSYDAYTVTGDLECNSFYDEPYPGDRFTPGQFAGLF